MNHKGRILVVDDTLDSLKLMSDTLKAEGYEVYATDNGELALGAAASRHPELVLCDMRMPGIDGLEVCRRLKQQDGTRDIPLMFISAATAVDERVAGFAAGAVDFVSKPFQRDELLARVRTHLELARLRAHLEQRVQDALGALRELNEQLETRVVERTSELENAHAKLRNTSGQLARAERMAALMTMVSGVARELALPVGEGLELARGLQRDAAALAPRAAETIGTDATMPQRLRHLADDAGQLTRRLTQAAAAIDDFQRLALERGGEPRSRFALSALVGEVLASQLKSFKATRHQVQLQIAPDLVLDSYPRALGQVLRNLLDNALTHAFAPGADGAIRIGASVGQPGQLLLVVADNGCGIDAGHLAHVFDPFFSSGKQQGQGGRGLGLSLVYATVTDILGGAVRAENDSGGGAVFTLALPLQAPLKPAAAP
ncbi:response regulator [Rugamonas sp.]|uniref:hybrid sensor histidine kinase/response regulator n=1 Tax=Rugamonas sp. TaxID=1926287 RepID=UPI0025ED40F1|nr:response regulator [Rugamonas sp.]